MKQFDPANLQSLAAVNYVTRSKGQLQLHNEDYSKPFDDAHPICRSCHLALHVRFTNPDRWEMIKDFIRSARGDGDYWWEKLINTPIDINPMHKS